MEKIKAKVIKIKEELYFTLDGPIEEKDWFTDGNNIYPSEFQLDDYIGLRKVIASTDTEIGHGNKLGQWDPLPQIPQSFIEEYCEKKGIDEVELEFEKYMTAGWVPSYNNPDNNNLEPPSEMDYRLKLTSNNEVVIHSIEDKVYSREEVESILYKYVEDEFAWFTTFKYSSKEEVDSLNEWIENNL